MSQNIAIVAPSPAPYQLGGAEKLVYGLRGALGRIPGVYAEAIKLPLRELSFAEVIGSYKMFYDLDLSHFDMVISTKYPSWMIRHKNHAVYMLHTLRGLYDTYGLSRLPYEIEYVPRGIADLHKLLKSPEPKADDLPLLFELCQRAMNNRALPSFLFLFPGPFIRQIVHFMDRAALADARAFAAISHTVVQREGAFPPGADVRVIYPPSDLPRFACGAGQYIFTCGRLHWTKRNQLLIEAMAHVDAPVKLLIGGTGPDEEKLKKLAAHDDRIEFCGFIPDEKLPDYYANAIFVPFVPYGEDYGLITIEAMKSGKPVLTVDDAGGVREFVENNVTGLCVEPNAEAVGRAMNLLAKSPEFCQKMGEKAREKVAGISWEATASALLDHAELAPLEKISCSRPRIVVCSHLTANRYGGGGERRLWHICKALARKWDIVVFSVGKRGQRILEVEGCAPGFSQIIFPWPQCGGGATESLRNRDNASVDDVQIMEWCATDAKMRQMLQEQAAGAICAIASHPYLYPLVRAAIPDLPLVYEAQDVELDVKANLLRQAPELLEKVGQVERDCVSASAAILVCAENDKRRLQELYDASQQNIYVIPNGVDETAFAGNSERKKTRRSLPSGKTAFFMGSGHNPNKDAVRHIAQIARKMPHVQFIVAGSVCLDYEIQKLESPDNMHLAGMVSENVKNILLSSAHVALNPITSGSGSNLKLVEYLASGLQCISTPFGMRGFDDDFAPAAVVCEIGEFSAQIDAILQNPAPEAELRRVAENINLKYSWPAVTTGLGRIISRAAKADAHE